MDKVLLNFNPCISFCFSACISKFENTSAQIMKRYCDNWHPCLNPLCGNIRPFATPIISTEKLATDMHFIIKFIQFEENPRCYIAP